ncbi:uncharacterized protein LOC132309588 [Cornus florida]|uniref:uncharacterized protein LOC132309588 n=1 Tax=Cornus florida TaxID=4283 RepID=UPI0028A29F6E|nr:uncharacterized protein LOC132309588 [Cornus florida]
MEVGERRFLGPEFIKDTSEKIALIKDRMHTAQNRQKSYADRRTHALEFQVGDQVLLKVSPRKGVMRFGKKGKLKFLRDENRYQHIDVGEIELQPDVTYVEPPYRIIDRRDQILRNKVIPLVTGETV